LGSKIYLSLLAAYGFPYPVVHERGSSKVNVPPRPVFELVERNNELMKNLASGLGLYIQKEVEKQAKRYFNVPCYTKSYIR